MVSNWEIKQETAFRLVVRLAGIEIKTGVRSSTCGLAERCESDENHNMVGNELCPSHCAQVISNTIVLAVVIIIWVNVGIGRQGSLKNFCHWRVGSSPT